MPQSSIRLLKKPTARREAASVRAARAVPTWQAAMPAKVIVVAFEVGAVQRSGRSPKSP